MLAWVKHNDRLQLLEVADPVAKPDELLVDVQAISLNRGEVRATARGAEGFVPGWDVAGVVVAAAASAEGPAVGTRVATMLDSGAWSGRVAVPVNRAAAVPPSLALPIAATLPLVGLTITAAFRAADGVNGKRVLITGASGGVGTLAVQLAALDGATVTAICSPAHEGDILRLGAATTIPNIREAVGEFDFILESVGGDSLATAIERIASGGTIVSIGNSSDKETTFNARTLFGKGAARIYGLIVFEEVRSGRVGARELERLLQLADEGTLEPVIEVERSWRDLDKVLDDLAHRRFAGKAVLHVD